jgi:hypothetical protein
MRVESNRLAGEIESISRDFDLAREATPPEAGSRFAHVMPIAEPFACPEDRGDGKDVPKRAMRDIGRS